MSDSELLSEEEILALVEMGEKEGVEAYNLVPDAEDYDISSEDSSLTSHLGSLDMINERFARLLRTSLKSLLRYQPKIEAHFIKCGEDSTLAWVNVDHYRSTTYFQFP